jgi:deoxyribodipyrimidine photolyase-related protein
MGWREFIRMVYLQIGSKQRTTNFWQFKRKIPLSFWQGNTGIDPVDITIKKTLATAYNHHIERLMVLGNFFLLCEFNPNHVYKWFMEMYIDAYDWVMVPNVYGMTQFADGGCITTKPYISSSNYLIKMGNYPKGKWQIIWDALFWRFLAVHENYFKKNIRMAMLLNTWHKMPAPKKESHLSMAENYLKQLDNS